MLLSKIKNVQKIKCMKYKNYTKIKYTLNVKLLESAESSPMQYNNSGLKLSFFGK